MQKDLVRLGREGDIKGIENLMTLRKVYSYQLGDAIIGYYGAGICRLDFTHWWLEHQDGGSVCNQVMRAVRAAADEAVVKTGGLSKCFYPDILDVFMKEGYLKGEDVLAAAIIAGDSKDVKKYVRKFDQLVKKYDPSQLSPGLSGFLSRERLLTLVREYWKRVETVEWERDSNIVGRLLARHRGIIFNATDDEDIGNQDVQLIIEKYNDEIWNVVEEENRDLELVALSFSTIPTTSIPSLPTTFS